MARTRRSKSLFHREQRAMNTTQNFSGWNDSLQLTGVVPPHGFDSLNLAGVNVTPKTVLSIGVVQRCLEVIQNALFVMGRPRAYSSKWDDDGFPYEAWMAGDGAGYPQLLSAPWGTSPFADNAPIAYNVGIGRTAVSMALFGEAWWWISSRDDEGYAASLQPLHPSFLEQQVDPDTSKLTGVFYGMGNKRIPLNPADLVHIPRTILPGDRSALNPIKTEAPIFAIAEAAVQYSQMWFGQGGQAGYVLTTEQKLNDKAVERIWESLLLEHSGIQKAYTPLILDSGITPKFIQTDPEKSQMNATLQYVREEISGYFGIPAHLVGTSGDSGGVWGKGVQEMNFSLNDFTLSGYRIPIEEAFSQILPKGIKAGINNRALLRANTLDNAKASQSNRMGAITTPDEERRNLGLPPKGTTASSSLTTPMNSNVAAPPDDNAGGDGGGEGE